MWVPLERRKAEESENLTLSPGSASVTVSHDLMSLSHGVPQNFSLISLGMHL